MSNNPIIMPTSSPSLKSCIKSDVDNIFADMTASNPVHFLLRAFIFSVIINNHSSIPVLLSLVLPNKYFTMFGNFLQTNFREFVNLSPDSSTSN
jgi:hypothetical protein